jgi:hypothetical protein
VLAELTLDRIVVVWIIGLYAIAVTLPNTQQFMHRFMNRDFYRIEPQRGWFGRFEWRGQPVAACWLALLTAVAVMSLWQPSVFLYYQF